MMCRQIKGLELIPVTVAKNLVVKLETIATNRLEMEAKNLFGKVETIEKYLYPMMNITAMRCPTRYMKNMLDSVSRWRTSRSISCIIWWCLLILIIDINYEGDRNFITPFAELGIKQFNKDENTNFEFVRLVNLTSRVVRGINYYVTFEAKDDSQIKTFQALVFAAPGSEKDELIFCRLKPPPTKKQGTEHEQVGQGLTYC